MNLTTLLLFIPACFALNMAPGPNNLLSVHNAAHYGFRSSVLGAGGRLAAFAIMIALASIGLTVVLQQAAFLLLGIKVLGALYLLYLAVQLWRKPVSQESVAGLVGQPISQLARQEFLVAAGNPKAILIFTAFFPQFIQPGGSYLLQFAWLGVLFLLMEVVAVALYAWMGRNLRQLLAKPGAQRLFNRTCGSLLGLAGVGLLLSRRGAAS
ncbi:LysE family translocator [Alcaligenes sp. WGS1538]|uniref:LysE family translocator n=1 Tax=Alcaligenes sp. WGS1538 TaxID=3366811 RepID=UPI00372D20E4